MNRQEAEKIKDDLDSAYHHKGSTSLMVFSQWFDMTYPREPEYIPFEYTDFNQFMLKEVQRKGDVFADEIWTVKGAMLFKTVFIYLQNTNEKSLPSKSLETMFEEWEFADGKPFGKLKK